MRPIFISFSNSATGTSEPVVLDSNKNPFNIGLGISMSSTGTYTVQYTFDGATWFDHPDLTAQTTKAESNIAFPVMYCRLVVTDNAGDIMMTVIQAGI